VVRDDFPYVSQLEETIRRLKPSGDALDPLLFVALMRRSPTSTPGRLILGSRRLDAAHAENRSGLGMKNIWMPAYFLEATGSRIRNEGQSPGHAALHRINEDNKIQLASEART